MTKFCRLAGRQCAMSAPATVRTFHHKNLSLSVLVIKIETINHKVNLFQDKSQSQLLFNHRGQFKGGHGHLYKTFDHNVYKCQFSFHDITFLNENSHTLRIPRIRGPCHIVLSRAFKTVKLKMRQPEDIEYQREYGRPILLL